MTDLEHITEQLQRYRDASAEHDWVRATAAVEELHALASRIYGKLQYYRDKEPVTPGKVRSW